MGTFYSFLNLHVNSINAKKKIDWILDWEVRFLQDKIELKGGLEKTNPKCK